MSELSISELREYKRRLQQILGSLEQMHLPLIEQGNEQYYTFFRNLVLQELNDCNTELQGRYDALAA